MIMKSRTFFILVFIFLVSLGCFSCKTTATDDFSIDSEIAYCRSQAMRTLVSIPSLDKIPNSMDLDSIKWRYTQVALGLVDFGPVSFGIYMRILRIICGGKQQGK